MGKLKFLKRFHKRCQTKQTNVTNNENSENTMATFVIKIDTSRFSSEKKGVKQKKTV